MDVACRLYLDDVEGDAPGLSSGEGDVPPAVGVSTNKATELLANDIVFENEVAAGLVKSATLSSALSPLCR